MTIQQGHNSIGNSIPVVINMTFWVRLWNELNFLELFKLYFHLGLIMTPHVFYDHMTYVYSLSYVSFFT